MRAWPLYRGDTDVLLICREDLCRSRRYCHDPLACTQIAHVLNRGLEAIERDKKSKAAS